MCLLLNSMVMEFDEIIFLTEDIDHLAKCLFGLFFLAPKNELRNPSLHTAGKSNQALGMLGQFFQIGSGTIIKTVHMSIRNHFAEVLIPFKILRQKTEMVRFVVFPPWSLVIFMIGYKVTFTTNNRFNSTLFRLLNKGYRPEQISVIRKSHGRHSQLDCPIHQTIHPTTTIKQAVVRMHVQMHKIFVFVSQG